MKVPVYHEADADLSIIQKKRVAFIGYGNQGAAQAKNLRDSGVQEILIGNIEDSYKTAALADGFRVVSIPEAAAWGDVLFLLIPDEDQPQVFREQIAPHLRPGTTLVVASGYNVAFHLLTVPDQIDIIMVAPRMVGAAVRELYVKKESYPCFVSVERDVSGNALPLALSIARGIGATRGGAIQSSALEEAALDLLSEQAIWPAIFVIFQKAYEVLHEAGFSDEAILHELYLSGEPAEIFKLVGERGLFGQLPFHSHTSQYGQLRGMLADDGEWARQKIKRVLEDSILSGNFAREWSDVQAKGLEKLEQLRSEALSSPVAQAEKRVMQEKGD
ncbi:MAG: NAD(P)-binding domain-containing protein [Chloroflexi bacterium]|nr:NAD(P)-binding domain-containing protein [Chloroflexota bacterium]